MYVDDPRLDNFGKSAGCLNESKIQHSRTRNLDCNTSYSNNCSMKMQYFDATYTYIIVV